MWSHRNLFFSDDYSSWTRQRLSEQALIDKLLRISPDGRLISSDFQSPENFDVCVKCCVMPDEPMTSYGEFAYDWIRTFSYFTSTSWVVKSTFPRLKTVVYRKIFACKYSGCKKNDLDDGKVKDCKAKIEFKMKSINKRTIKKDPLLEEGYNMMITVSFHHSHSIYEEEALQAYKVSPETDEKLIQYLEMGCTGPAAKFFLELMLFDEYGDDPKIMSNESLNPSLRHVTYLINKMNKEGFAPRNYYSIIREKKSLLAETGTLLSYASEERVTIITPTMRRTIEEFGLYHIIVDTTNVPNGPRVDYAYIPTNIGALPVCCSIENLQKRHGSFTYTTLKLAISAVLLTDYNPGVIMFNEAHEMKSVSLAKQETQSKMFVSQYEMCRATWSWLNDDNNDIDKNMRHGLMVSVRQMFRAKTETAAEKLYAELMENQYVNTTPKLKEYLKSLWDSRKQWLCEFDGFSSDLVDMSIRLNKEFLVRRCNSFNLCLMVDAVTKVLEPHQKRILRSFVENKDITKTYTKFLAKAKVMENQEKTLMFDGSEVRKVGENEYHIGSQTGKFLTLRTDTMFCDCLYGKRGEFCAHLGAIIDTDCEMMKPPELSREDTLRYTHVAGKVDENGEFKQEEQWNEYNSEDEDYENEYMRDVRGVAVPLHDARDLLPANLDNSDEEQEEAMDWIRDRIGNRPRMRNNPAYDLFRIPERFNFARQIAEDRVPREQVEPIRRVSNNITNTRNEPTSTAKQESTENIYHLILNDTESAGTSTSNTNDMPCTSSTNNDMPSTSGTDLKRKYDPALKALNNEFSRLHKFFSENPNHSNLEAMTRLTRELGKIKPVEKVQLEKMELIFNDKERRGRKRRCSRSSASDSDSYSDYSM